MMKTDRVTRKKKIASAVFPFVALLFMIASSPCYSQPIPPSQGETVPVWWQPLPALSSANFDSPHLDHIDLDRTAESPGPVLHLSLNTSRSPFSPGLTEAVQVLWQAPKLAELTVPQPVGPSASESPQTGAEEAAVNETIADPLEPVNRVFFGFNDKLYFWLLKPVASGYKAVFPQDLRVCFRNFFSNLVSPVRFANSLLQAEFKGAGNEAARFGLNTTLGFFGFFDQAKDKFEIDKQDRDLGQTLGIWGFGPAFYINWPVLGPSSLRDTAGFVGDHFFDPRTYLLSWPVSTGVRSAEIVNNTSLTLGEYEDFKKAALDPYVSMRDGYNQYRENKIKKKK